MTPLAGATPYDEVRYPSYTHTPSHPDRLATQAILFGLTPAPVAACRVLELGCGDGSNLVPMAYGLPGSHFTGIDLAKCAVERGQGMIADLGLTNVELRQGDLLGIDESWGEFDYIIVHGVYSWVPREVREKILSICQEHLAPQGVAFISYLAYPGAHVRAMLRDLMLYRAGDTQEPAAILAAGREAATLIASAAPAGDFVQRAFQAEAERALAALPDFLFHDDLAEWNVPFYFVQFVNAAAGHGLQFLAEVEPTEMQNLHLTPPVREQLLHLGRTRIEQEQYLDFLRARRFRQTLLCRAATTVDASARAKRVSKLWVASCSTGPKGPVDLAPEVEVTFHSPRGPKLETRFAAGKAALAVLLEAWPMRLPCAEVIAGARSRLLAAGLPAGDTQDFDQSLHEFLLQLNDAGVIDFHMDPTRQMSRVSERPIATAVARWQAQRGNFVTSLRHFGITFKDETTLRLLPLLDGTRDRPALIEALLAGSAAEKLPDDAPAGRDHVAAVLTERLDCLTLHGFLIG